MPKQHPYSQAPAPGQQLPQAWYCPAQEAKLGKNGGKNGNEGGKNGKNGKNGGKNGNEGGKNGKNGGATGVTELDGDDAADIAITLLSALLVLAVTVNVYAVPFVNPVTDIGDVAEDPVNDPGEDMATYILLVDGFPKYEGAVNGILAEPLPAVAVPNVGAVGWRPSEDADTPGIIGTMQPSLQQEPKYFLHV